jgi:uncharacterized membrane protein
MKVIHFLLLVCAGLMIVSPAYAHGDKAHGDGPKVEASSAAGNGHADPGALSRTTDRPSAEAQSSVLQDEASGDHEGTQSGGLVASLKTLHPATVHFPIALFLMAAVAELFLMAGRGKGIEPAVRVLVYGGAAGAVVAALFGWIHTGLWFGGDTAMQLHRWNGMLIAVFGLAFAAILYRPRESRMLLRTGLFAMVALILLQGFLGGELAHGPDHLGLSRM